MQNVYLLSLDSLLETGIHVSPLHFGVYHFNKLVWHVSDICQYA